MTFMIDNRTKSAVLVVKHVNYVCLCIEINKKNWVLLLNTTLYCTTVHGGLYT